MQQLVSNSDFWLTWELGAATANSVAAQANLQVCPVQAPCAVWAYPSEIHRMKDFFRTGWALESKCNVCQASGYLKRRGSGALQLLRHKRQGKHEHVRQYDPSF